MVVNFFIYLFLATCYTYVKPTTYFEFDHDDDDDEPPASAELNNSPRKRQKTKPEVLSESEM